MNFYANLARAGFCPEVIYDISAASGWWSKKVAGLFSMATFHYSSRLLIMWQDTAKDCSTCVRTILAIMSIH